VANKEGQILLVPDTFFLSFFFFNHSFLFSNKCWKKKIGYLHTTPALADAPRTFSYLEWPKSQETNNNNKKP
jgi:hypothetical protein